MKTRFTVLVYPRQDELRQLDVLVERIGREYLVQGTAAYYEFRFNDEGEVARFNETAYELGVGGISTQKEYVYTVPEKLAAPLLWLSVKTAPKSDGGPTFGTGTTFPSAAEGADAEQGRRLA
jgi:hypothetical protein